MNKTAIVAIALAIVIAGVGIVMAAGPRTLAPTIQGAYHDQMEQILDDGSYSDLEALRAETGMPLNPRIQSQEDFDAWKERHAAMEQYRAENGFASTSRGLGKQGIRQFARGGCPMMD